MRGGRWIDGWKDGRKDWKNERKEGEKEKKGSSVSSYKTTNPVSSFPCLWLHWTIINFPRGPISKYKHTRDKASNIHIWGGYIQSTTVLLIQSLPLPPTVSLSSLCLYNVAHSWSRQHILCFLCDLAPEFLRPWVLEPWDRGLLIMPGPSSHGINTWPQVCGWFWSFLSLSTGLNCILPMIHVYLNSWHVTWFGYGNFVIQELMSL